MKMDVKNKINKKIDFIGVGVMKAGTTALYHYLCKHPDIAMYDWKELHYFSNPTLDFQIEEQNNYVDYHQHFDWNTEKIKGEITPLYCYSKTAIAHIFKYNPQMKIILILRNPIERAFSHWNMRLSKKEIDASFLDYIKADILRHKFNVQFEQYPEDDYVRRGFYFEQLNRIYQFFPTEQVHIIKYEDFRANQQQALIDILLFLGLDGSTFNNFEEKQVYHFPYTAEMDVVSFKLLHELYIPEIEKIEKTLNWNCSDWKYGKI
jgi:hypothetical protein